MDSKIDVKDFSVDFSDGDLILVGKAYPKGTFAVNMLNRDKEKNTALLTEALPLYEVLQERVGGFFSPELFEKAKKATRKVAEMLYGDEPFSLLDVKAEKAKLELLFSEEVKDFLCLYDEGLTEYRKAQSEPDFHEEEIDEEARAFLRKGERLMKKFTDTVRFYAYVPHDIVNFENALLNFEQEKLANLKKRDEANFAKAYTEFFSDPDVLTVLHLSQPSRNMEGLNLCPRVRLQYLPVKVPQKKNAVTLARRMYFGRLMDFLVTDLLEGIHAGHSPKQCEICHRYFLMKDGRHQKYCDGFAPNDPKGRTCRTVGCRIAREKRENAKDHPAKKIYNTRCNTVDHHLRDGKIEKPFAVKVKELARDKLDRAIQDNEYFLTRYESEMKQSAIYAEAKELLK